MQQTQKTPISILTSTAKTSTIIGWTMCILFAIGILSFASSTTIGSLAQGLYIIICSAFILVSFLLIIGGYSTKNIIKRYSKYKIIFSTQKRIPIDAIAAAMSKPVAFVTKDLELLVSKDLFINSYIDKKTNEFIYKNENINGDAESESNSVVVLNCPGCGAVNSVQKGTSVTCEYCGQSIGSKMEAKK